MFNTKCTVSRSIKDSGKVFIEGDFSDFPIKPQTNLDGHYYKLKDWTELLGQYTFNLNETIKYELNTRLSSMPTHSKLCHGDFNPSNIIVPLLPVAS